MDETLGLYISIPFCRAKCTYCNFASGVFPASDQERYVDRVCGELEDARRRAEQEGWDLPQEVGSIYLGGGTPSTLQPPHLHHIFTTISRTFTTRDAEITIECAPGQISAEFLKAMVEVSATRVSLGVQSLVDREAAGTGRSHTRRIVEEDVRRLHNAGLAVNVDLIAGLPGQTLASWLESLEALSNLQVEHASLYMLEVDEDSRLGRELIGKGTRYGAGLVPADDTVATMYEEGIKGLSAAGLVQYEISNFARAGHQSRHNLRYWHRKPYLGLGLDAHSMLRTRDGRRAVRFGNTDDLAVYLAGVKPLTPETIGREAELEEAWFLSLRLNEGVSLSALRDEFGDSVDASGPIRKQLIQEGLLEDAGDKIRLTDRGRLLSNEVFERFVGIVPETVVTAR
jgi:oxygen-independent coproporphyrinogen-3 oxidase